MRLPACFLFFVGAASSGLIGALAPANYDEAKVGALALPDPLVCEDGTKVQDVSTWVARRRGELLALFAANVYGRTPFGRPPAMHWEVTSVDRAALNGKATRKEVTLWFTEKRGDPKMSLLVYQPNGPAGPWPVFVGLNFFGNESIHADPRITLSQSWLRDSAERHIVDHHATDKTRGTDASRWEVERVLAHGYATATVCYNDLCSDRAAGLKDGIGAMHAEPNAYERLPDDWGAIGMWAWGLSRMMDYVESDNELDAKRVAVHGHSRLGKAALWAAAQDPRFALVISNESGCGGAALSKRIYGETVAIINDRCPWWFAPNFRRYDDNEAALPVDQHELLALIAPRPLYVASAEGNRTADPKGEFLSLKYAEPVYKLLGNPGLGTETMPPLETPVGETIAYHIRRGNHDILPYDWIQFLDFADRHFKKSR